MGDDLDCKAHRFRESEQPAAAGRGPGLDDKSRLGPRKDETRERESVSEAIVEYKPMYESRDVGPEQSVPVRRPVGRGCASNHVVLLPEVPAAERVAARRAAERRCRVYCLACGRATEQASAPAHPGRCAVCGGTLLTEPLFGLG